MKPISLGNISTISTETWLQWREHGPAYSDPQSSDYIDVTITGSQAPIVFGSSPYMSSLELAYSKNGQYPTLDLDKKSKKEVFETGHLFEPFVAIQFVRWIKKNYPNKKVTLEKNLVWELATAISAILPEYTSGIVSAAVKKVSDHICKKFTYNPDIMYQCGDRDGNGNLLYPWMVVNTDGFVVIDGKRFLIECKTTSAFTSVCECAKNGICPPEYDPQCRHSMKVMDLDGCFLIVCWGLKLEEMAVVFVERDEQAENELIEKEVDFVNAVRSGTEPTLSYQSPELISNYLLRLYGKAPTFSEKQPPLQLSKDNRDFILSAIRLEKERQIKEKEIKELEQKKAELFNEIYPQLGGRTTCIFQLNQNILARMKVKVSMHREKFDTERFRQEQPVLFRKYSEPSFNVKALELENPRMKNLYTKPAEVNLNQLPTFELEVRGKE